MAADDPHVGAGIGLATARRRIVAPRGNRTRAESALGTGPAFQFVQVPEAAVRAA